MPPTSTAMPRPKLRIAFGKNKGGKQSVESCPKNRNSDHGQAEAKKAADERDGQGFG